MALESATTSLFLPMQMETAYLLEKDLANQTQANHLLAQD
jgi:hypothetical protein